MAEEEIRYVYTFEGLDEMEARLGALESQFDATGSAASEAGSAMDGDLVGGAVLGAVDVIVGPAGIVGLV